MCRECSSQSDRAPLRFCRGGPPEPGGGCVLLAARLSLAAAVCVWLVFVGRVVFGGVP